MNEVEAFYRQVLYDALGTGHQLQHARTVGGGCINHGVVLQTSHATVFLKWNPQLDQEVFEKEARGLRLLRDPGILNVPEPLQYGSLEGRSYLLMEYIESGAPRAEYWSDFGASLSAIHSISNSKFGLDHNNYIGSLPQDNDPHESWVEFFIEARIKPQVEIGRRNGLIDALTEDRFERLFLKLADLLPEEQPGLLHGDLWSGNVMTGPDGAVCLIDPAVYYGCREMELAFTRLFGGFDRGFYEAYMACFPLAPGHEERVDLYNLYPLLVHANLFGSGYLSQVQQVIARFL